MILRRTSKIGLSLDEGTVNCFEGQEDMDKIER